MSVVRLLFAPFPAISHLPHSPPMATNHSSLPDGFPLVSMGRKPLGVPITQWDRREKRVKKRTIDATIVPPWHSTRETFGDVVAVCAKRQRGGRRAFFRETTSQLAPPPTLCDGKGFFSWTHSITQNHWVGGGGKWGNGQRGDRANQISNLASSTAAGDEKPRWS